MPPAQESKDNNLRDNTTMKEEHLSRHARRQELFHFSLMASWALPAASKSPISPSNNSQIPTGLPHHITPHQWIQKTTYICRLLNKNKNPKGNIH
jgi:hypothetical protein